MVTNEDLSKALGLSGGTGGGNRLVYGKITAKNQDGTYQVDLDGSGTTAQCARFTGADVGDVVAVNIMDNGHTAVSGRVGGDKDALEAKQIAGNTNQYFWHTETGTDTGAHITEVTQEEFLQDPTNGGGNLLARSNGIALRNGLIELATLRQSGLDVNSFDNGGNLISIAHLGYGEGTAQSGTAVAPYFVFGVQGTGTVGNYSLSEGQYTLAHGLSSHAEGAGSQANGSFAHAEGFYSTASATVSHAEGYETVASGRSSHAQNYCTEANNPSQTVIGQYNALDTAEPYDENSTWRNPTNLAFIIGNGYHDTLEDVDVKRNAFAVSWDGNVRLSLDTSAAAGTVDGDLYRAIPSDWRTGVLD